MFWVVSAMILLGMVAAVAVSAGQFAAEGEVFGRRWFVQWFLRGCLAPILVWFLMNIGEMPLMPPLSRAIEKMRVSGHATEALMTQLLCGFWCIIPAWTALSFGWYFTRLFHRSKNKDDIAIAGFLFALPVLLMLALLLWGGAYFWSLILLAIYFSVMAFYSLNIARTSQHDRPAYSAAIGKMKFGKYAEAEQVIIAELEKCQTDFDGWMMLADLYANHFHDVAEAEKCVLDLCQDPRTPFPQVAIALNKLADWHLALRKDPPAARRALEMICGRMPGTILAQAAASRLRAMPSDRKELEALTHQRVIPLPHLEDSMDSPPRIAPNQEKDAVRENPSALQSVRACVEQLTRDPNDVEVRETLAGLYADKLGQIPAAIEQLELLIAMPHQVEEKIPVWLVRIAEWHAKEKGHDEACREILHRLTREYPQSKQAFEAQRRLWMLQVEDRGAKRAT